MSIFYLIEIISRRKYYQGNTERKFTRCKVEYAVGVNLIKGSKNRFPGINLISSGNQRSFVKMNPSTQGAAHQGAPRGLGEGGFGFGRSRVPILAHPELACPLIEAKTKSFVLIGPETTRAACL
jgi:hypothetical protein